MKTVQKRKPLSKLVTIPPKEYNSTNIEHDDITALKNYLPSASTLEIVERFSAGLSGAKDGRMLSITGPYGSGKSTMATFLKGLLVARHKSEWKTAHNVLKRESFNVTTILLDAREKANIHQKGMLVCAITARREPITATILKALDDGATKYFDKYTTKHFSTARHLKKHIRNLKKTVPSVSEITEIIVDMCKIAPVVIILDEFGKNIEYFTTDETQESDLFLLQELAEMSGPGRKIPLSIITLQHMAFEEYAVGASHARKQEWAKIQGRFEDIPFANSPNQTRQLISNTIKLTPNNSRRRIVRNWAKSKAKLLQNLGIEGGFDPDLIASCYPLEPLALEVLPELCSRYGQHERTLLSFISDGGKNTVATFIDENYWQDDKPPTIGLDTLYDYFISGTSMINSSSANITRLMEIETIIRDSYGLDKIEIKTLKTIGILNLIARSGYLRASQQIIDYVIGAKSKQILKKLQNKSIITYRKYADEYRIWHGTDIDIAAKLDMYKKRYSKSSLTQMLQNVIELEPVVAAKHNIKYGTMRLFERRFATSSEIILDDSYDGAILYDTGSSTNVICNKPLITVKPEDTSILLREAINVMAIRDILENDQDVISDWVSHKELEERLSDAEIILDREFGNTHGSTARWSYDNKMLNGTPSAIASTVSDDAYPDTPKIHNEMINRTILSSQGTAAKRQLLENMIIDTNKARFGIDGYGPDRAVYEAIFVKNNIHVADSNLDWKLKSPSSDNTLYPVWDKILKMLKKSKKRVSLHSIHQLCKMPPYGMKTGTIDIIITTILLIYKNNIALYEHGTYSPKLGIEIVERMIKNPSHFELKYFTSTASKKQLLSTVIKDFDINSEGSVLDVVSHLVRITSVLVPYARQTKNLDKNTIAVRNTILEAREPDTLLFESLPKALGFDSFNSDKSKSEITKFSKTLTKSKTNLQNAYSKMLQDIKKMLFDYTGIDDRKKVSQAASVMLKNVTDHKMKVFLTVVSSDTIDREEDWISYIALSLTDVPPESWKDDQCELFENNLAEVSRRFKRLASMNFSDVSDNFVKPSYQITVTHADGREHNNIVSLKPEQKKKMEKIVNKILVDMKKNGFTDKDVDALVAILSEK